MMLETTRVASWANVESCGCISMRSSRFATSAATTSTPAPMTTTIHDGQRRGRAEREPDADHLEERATRLGETVALEQVLARQDVGDGRRLNGEHHAACIPG